MSSCVNCARDLPGEGTRICRRYESCPVAAGDVDPADMPAGTWRDTKDGGR
jgi:hypothetical protein